MNELWIIHDQVVGEGKRQFHRGFVPKSDWNYAFYRKEDGKVYGQRIIVDKTLPWLYLPGDEPLLDTFIESPADIPDGAFEFYVNFLAEKILWGQKLGDQK